MNRVVFVLSWTFLTMVTSTRKLYNNSKVRSYSLNKLSGKFSLQLSKRYAFSTPKISCTETSNAPTSSFRRTGGRSWATWTCRRWPRRVFCTHRLALLTTLRQKSGGINPTTANLIYGRWVASFTRWLRWSLPSGPQTWTGFSNVFAKVLIHRSVIITRRNSQVWWLGVYRSIPETGPAVTRYWRWRMW